MRSAVFSRVLGVPLGASGAFSKIDINPVDPVVAARWLAQFHEKPCTEQMIMQAYRGCCLALSSALIYLKL